MPVAIGEDAAHGQGVNPCVATFHGDTLLRHQHHREAGDPLVLVRVEGPELEAERRVLEALEHLALGRDRRALVACDADRHRRLGARLESVRDRVAE